MFNILLAVVCVEAITNILTKSELFLPIRKFLFDRQFSLFCRWLHSLLDCGYCTSVWVGWFIAIMYLIGLLDNVFFWGLALHRMSNLLHHIIDRVWGKENI
jgi:hypothetical protein